MATVVNPPERRVILNGVSWETFERLLAERAGGSGARFAYDSGTLEIMTTSFRHEKIKRAIDTVVELIAKELKIPVQGAGSTTFKRKDLAKGFEPDACFYIEHFEHVRGLDEIELDKDPAPDLVIEIDITNSSLNKFSIYAALHVAEVWRYSGDGFTIFTLDGSTYREQQGSIVFRKVTAVALNKFVPNGDIELQELMKDVHDWAQRMRG